MYKRLIELLKPSHKMKVRAGKVHSYFEEEIQFARRHLKRIILGFSFVIFIGLVLFLLLSGSENAMKTVIDFEIKIIGGLVVLYAAYAAWRRVNVMEKGRITERFTRAIDQIGATNAEGKPQIEIRLGGIFALEQIARENPDEYHSQIMEILTAYVRENAPWPPKEKSGELESKPGVAQSKDETKEIKPPEDVQAVLTVIGRRERTWLKGETVRLNLSNTDLRVADLWKAHLVGAIALTIEQLSQVKTLYKTKLDPELLEQVREKYPHLLEEPK